MRTFPKPSKDALFTFIYNNVKLDHQTVTFEELNKSSNKKETDLDINPHAAGHFKALNYVLHTAPKDEIFLSSAWIQKLNELLTVPIAEYDIKTLNPAPFLRTNCGALRSSPQRHLDHICPPPGLIQAHLTQLNKFLYDIDLNFAQKINNPRNLTQQDIKDLASAAEEAHIYVLLIQPFKEANGRTARLVELLARLHFGLPIKQPAVEDQARRQFLEKAKNTPLLKLEKV